MLGVARRATDRAVSTLADPVAHGAIAGGGRLRVDRAAAHAARMTTA